MLRCGSGFLITLVIIFVSAFTGCLGKSSNNSGNGGVQSVTLNPPGSVSLNVGTTQVFSATGRDAHNVAVPGANIQFIVESGNPNTAAPLSIINNQSGSGSACAGTWDPTGTMCNPGPPGIAYVTAVTNGFSSPRTTVFVHQPIDTIQIVQAEPQPPQYLCFSQGQTWQFQGIAYSNGVDITQTVGPMSWSSTNPEVVSTNSSLATLLPNQVQTTARTSGITHLFASVSGPSGTTTSSPYPYTTCLIQAIYLEIGGQSQGGNSITINNGGTAPITAIAVDTLCGIANNTALANPPLTWSTTNPDVAAFTTTTNSSGSNGATARNNLGGATLTASCTPPGCNIGLPLSTASEDLPSLPIYASNFDATAPPANNCRPPLTKGYSAISVNVTSTATVPTYTAWAATTDCNDAPGCSSALFSVTRGTPPIGPIVGLPRTPNSMLFDHQATHLYIGSDQGLMYVDVTATSPGATLVSASPTPCKVSLCGKVLTISNDNKLVVISDTVSTPNQVYIYNGSTAPVDLVIPGETATAAAFSPDQLKLFILTSTGNMYVYSTVDAFSRVTLAAPASMVSFSADGSFAYVAGTPANSVSAYSTCSLPNVASVDIGSVATSSTPLKIFPSPAIPPPLAQDGFLTTQKVLALEPPNVQVLTAQFTQEPILYHDPLQLTCNPPLLANFTAAPPVNLGQGNFTPVYSQLVGNGIQLLIVARHIPAILLFDVTNGTTMSVPLVNNPNSPDPLSASASSDGSQVFVAACDAYPNNDSTQPCSAGSVHIVNTVNGGDLQEVPYVNINDNNNPNMCNNSVSSAPLCLPNLIAIRPQ